MFKFRTVKFLLIEERFKFIITVFKKDMVDKDLESLSHKIRREVKVWTPLLERYPRDFMLPCLFL